MVVYNLGIAGATAYENNNSRTALGITAAGNVITLTGGKQFPFESPGARFQVISTPVTYVCEPTASGVNGRLTRYWGYNIRPNQPNGVNVTNQLLEGGVVLGSQNRALLATNVSTCGFTYEANVVSQRAGLVTMRLAITEPNPSGGNETVLLYSATHVSNQP